MKLVEGFDSNYRYVLVAARRARQIQNGAQPAVEPHSHKPCRIAEEEVQAGKVKWEIPAASGASAMEAAPEGGDTRVGGEADD
jgi:DNA-directed RNA polymerase subunit omega